MKMEAGLEYEKARSLYICISDCKLVPSQAKIHSE
jgi:hypothetical protein